MLPFLNQTVFIVFSSISLIVGKEIKYRPSDFTFDQDTGDGEQFIKKYINGDKMSERPGVLMFTAPYKLCDPPGCNGSEHSNIMLQFPLFIGRKGREAYRRMFRRDFEQLHSTNTAAPFKKQTTKGTTTASSCIILKLKLIPRTEYEPSTTTTTTTSTSTKTTTTTTSTTTTTTTTTNTSTTPATTTSTEPSTKNCPNYPPGICFKRIKHKAKHITTEDETVFLTNVVQHTTNESNVETTLEYTDNVLNKSQTVIEKVVLRHVPEQDEVDFDDDLISDYDFYNYGYPRINDTPSKAYHDFTSAYV